MNAFIPSTIGYWDKTSCVMKLIEIAAMLEVRGEIDALIDVMNAVRRLQLNTPENERIHIGVKHAQAEPDYCGCTGEKVALNKTFD